MKIAVVGHTNVGKTSLLRTLTRSVDFGDVSLHPATTRHVERAVLAVKGHEDVALFDTPGLEDSSGLLAYITALKEERGEDWVECLSAFSSRQDLQSSFTQEAKAIGQVLKADVVLYVIDARLKVRAKYRDELEILGRCARPVVPVLNFILDENSQADAWRAQLARVNMHAVVAFDTVVFDELGEISLYRKIATLLDAKTPVFEALIDALQDRRRQVKKASATIIAEMLIDCLMARRLYEKDDEQSRDKTAEELKSEVRTREKQAVSQLLETHMFDLNSYIPGDLNFTDGDWADDPFDAKVLERFGLDASKAMVSGAAAGLAIDLMVGGISLGAAALTGAALGFLVDSARRYGGRVQEFLSGQAVMKVDMPTLKLLASRETALLQALLHRGHGAQDPINWLDLSETDILVLLFDAMKKLPAKSDWSRLNGEDGLNLSTRRRSAIQDLAGHIEKAISSSS